MNLYLIITNLRANYYVIATNLQNAIETFEKLDKPEHIEDIKLVTNKLLIGE